MLNSRGSLSSVAKFGILGIALLRIVNPLFSPPREERKENGETPTKMVRFFSRLKRGDMKRTDGCSPTFISRMPSCRVHIRESG